MLNFMLELTTFDGDNVRRTTPATDMTDRIRDAVRAGQQILWSG